MPGPALGELQALFWRTLNGSTEPVLEAAVVSTDGSLVGAARASVPTNFGPKGAAEQDADREPAQAADQEAGADLVQGAAEMTVEFRHRHGDAPFERPDRKVDRTGGDRPAQHPDERLADREQRRHHIAIKEA